MTETITVAKGPFHAAWDALRTPHDYNGVPVAAGYACAMLEVAHDLGEKDRPASEADAARYQAEAEAYVEAARRAGFRFDKDGLGRIVLFKMRSLPSTDHAA